MKSAADGHASATSAAAKLVDEARRALSEAAELLRSAAVRPSRAAMECEAAVTRSLDALSGPTFLSRLAGGLK